MSLSKARDLLLSTFAELGLIEPLLRAVAQQNYVSPTPIQAQSIKPLLEGRDLLGCAQTGTGKTAAFALPILQSLAKSQQPGRRRTRALVLSPTRELAAQIGENFTAYAQFLDFNLLTIFGGVNQNPQVRALRQGVDIIVATPGRLLDLMQQGFVDLGHVEHFVLDEADRMLDMGFIHDIRRVLKVLPNRRQNLLFSATMPDAIAKLAQSFLHEPIRVEVVPQATTAERIEQQLMFVERPDKRRLLVDLFERDQVECSIVFTRTKRGANRLCQQLERAGITAMAIHGNKSQNARRRALNSFREGTVRALIATDIASRGIDVDSVTHVFNYDLPNEPESYVHRIGRTARAGRSGIAVSFCDPSESEYLLAIEKVTGEPIPVIEDHEYHCEAARPKRNQRPAPRRGGGGGGQHRGGSRGHGGHSGGSHGGGSHGGGGNRRRRPSSSRRSGPANPA